MSTITNSKENPVTTIWWMTNQNNQTKKPYRLVTLAFLPKSIVWSICRLSSVFLLDNLIVETVADNLFLLTCRKFLDMSKPYEIKQKNNNLLRTIMNITPAFSSLFFAFTLCASSNPKGIVLRLEKEKKKKNSSHIQVFKTPKESTSHI